MFPEKNKKNVSRYLTNVSLGRSIALSTKFQENINALLEWL